MALEPISLVCSCGLVRGKRKSSLLPIRIDTYRVQQAASLTVFQGYKTPVLMLRAECSLFAFITTLSQAWNDTVTHESFKTTHQHVGFSSGVSTSEGLRPLIVAHGVGWSTVRLANGHFSGVIPRVAQRDYLAEQEWDWWNLLAKGYR